MGPSILRHILFQIILACLLVAGRASASPCLMATPTCTEWIGLQSASRSLVFRTYPLQQKNESVTRALVMVHGAGRDADNYFRTALAAAFLAGALENTVSFLRVSLRTTERAAMTPLPRMR